MGVKYGDIARKSVDALDEKYYADKIKIQDKSDAGDNVLQFLPKYSKGLGLKVVYKTAVEAVSGLRAEASADFTQKNGTEPEVEVQLNKGNISANLKREVGELAEAEVAVKETVLGAKAALSLKLNEKFEHTIGANAGYQFALTDALTLQAGAKVKVTATKQKPEASVGLLSSFGEFLFQWQGADAKKFYTTSFYLPGPSFAGFDWSLVSQFNTDAAFQLTNTAAVVQASQGRDFSIKAKVDKITSDKPEPSVSVLLAHKPIAESKETVSITGTWGYTEKGHVVGLFASRA